MKFSAILSALVMMASATIACSPDQNCCWSSRQGFRNQHHIGKQLCDNPSYVGDYCENFGVSCGADCCRIDNGWGRGCP